MQSCNLHPVPGAVHKVTHTQHFPERHTLKLVPFLLVRTVKVCWGEENWILVYWNEWILFRLSKGSPRPSKCVHMSWVLVDSNLLPQEVELLSLELIKFRSTDFYCISFFCVRKLSLRVQDVVKDIVHVLHWWTSDYQTQGTWTPGDKFKILDKEKTGKEFQSEKDLWIWK